MEFLSWTALEMFFRIMSLSWWKIPVVVVVVKVLYTLYIRYRYDD